MCGCVAFDNYRVQGHMIFPKFMETARLVLRLFMVLSSVMFVNC